VRRAAAPVAVIFWFAAPGYSAGSVNPFGGTEFIFILGGLLLFIAAQIYFAIKNISTYTSAQKRFTRYLGIWSGPIFWPFLNIRETYYISEIVYRISFALLALFFLAPFVCRLILSRG